MIKILLYHNPMTALMYFLSIAFLIMKTLGWMSISLLEYNSEFKIFHILFILILFTLI